jgi:hypothetical protein
MSAWRAAVPRWLALAALAAACAAVIATYGVFNQTFDEPAHLATGLEWLEKGTYTLEPLHPPVARVATALGPFLDGARGQGAPWLFPEGNRILWAQHTYLRTLGLARLGVLPFFVLAVVVTWFWARRLFGEGAALGAVLALVTLPPMLAHAGVAATDMGHTGTLMLALLAAMLWLESPSRGRAVFFGAATGLAAVTKFSAGVFFPPLFLLLVLARRFIRRDDAALSPAVAPRAWVASFALAVVAGLVVLLAAYRFQTAPFIAGLQMLREHQRLGHDAYLLGMTGDGGWWHFFPVTFVVKTPLPFMLLAGAGAWLLVRRARLTRDWRVVAASAGALLILPIAMTSRVTIGLRHVLPMYPLLAIAAGFALWRLWSAPVRRPIYRGAAVLLLGWQAAQTARAHPDYLAWFNAFAGRDPARIIVAGDLDWGQDLLRLADTARARGVDSLALAYYGSADPRRILPMPVRPLAPDERPGGWVAVSEAVIKGVGFEPHRGFEWLDSVAPVSRPGPSIRLYHFPRGGAAP